MSSNNYFCNARVIEYLVVIDILCSFSTKIPMVDSVWRVTIFQWWSISIVNMMLFKQIPFKDVLTCFWWYSSWKFKKFFSQMGRFWYTQHLVTSCGLWNHRLVFCHQKTLPCLVKVSLLWTMNVVMWQHLPSMARDCDTSPIMTISR